MIEGINRLAPANALLWHAGEEMKIWTYWELEVNDELFTEKKDRLIYEREFRELFTETVRLHLQADVPVGSCLSGGLDSSTIVCIINKELREKNIWREDWQHVFTACFDDPAIDEREYMYEVVRATNATSHTVFPTGAKLCEEIETWLWHQEEPVGGAGTYAHYCVARLAREQGIKVLLDGQGADEQLAGYRKFILVYLRQLAAKGHYIKAASEGAKFFISPEILRTSDYSFGRRYLYNKLNEVERVFGNRTIPQKPSSLSIEPSVAKRIEADLMKSSLPTLLRYEDRNTMAFGIEARVPFVDHLFVEFLAKLPSDMRLSNGWTKRILRDAFADILPDKIRKRKSKLGFSTPLTRWIKEDLRDWMEEMLGNPHYISDIVDEKETKKLLREYYEGRTPATTMNLLFQCAIYESWARIFLSTANKPEVNSSQNLWKPQ
jgi:asparagine synthase (glutamine-hydrolysing)